MYMYIFITKINNFRGDLSDLSAKTATLVVAPGFIVMDAHADHLSCISVPSKVKRFNLAVTARWMSRTCWATTDRTSRSIRLNSSKHALQSHLLSNTVHVSEQPSWGLLVRDIIHRKEMDGDVCGIMACTVTCFQTQNMFLDAPSVSILYVTSSVAKRWSVLRSMCAIMATTLRRPV